MARQEGGDQLAVFARVHGAGGVHQPAAGPEQGRQALQQLALQHHQPVDRGGPNPPAGIGMAGQGAQARARGIHQDPVKPALPPGAIAGAR